MVTAFPNPRFNGSCTSVDLNPSGVKMGGFIGAPPSGRSHAQGTPPTRRVGSGSAPALRAGGGAGHPTPFPPAASGGRAGRARVSHRARSPAVGGAPRGCPAGPPSLRRRTRPPAPSRAGSPADVSRPCARRPRGGGRSRARGGGPREWGGSWRCAAAGATARLSPARLPSTVPGCTAVPSAARSDSRSSCRPRWEYCASGSQSIPSDGPS